MKKSEHDIRAKKSSSSPDLRRAASARNCRKPIGNIGYQVIASSRSMRKSDDPAIAGDRGDDITRSRGGRNAFWVWLPSASGRIDTLVNNAGVFIPKPFTRIFGKGLRNDDRGKSRGILSFVAEGRSLDAADGLGPHRYHHDNDCRTAGHASLRKAALAALTKGRAQRDHALARDRVCQPSRSGERRLAGRDQDADAFAGGARLSQRAAADG